MGNLKKYRLPPDRYSNPRPSEFEVRVSTTLLLLLRGEGGEAVDLNSNPQRL
jgi:hypothetical protein